MSMSNESNESVSRRGIDDATPEEWDEVAKFVMDNRKSLYLLDKDTLDNIDEGLSLANDTEETEES